MIRPNWADSSSSSTTVPASGQRMDSDKGAATTARAAAAQLLKAATPRQRMMCRSSPAMTASGMEGGQSIDRFGRLQGSGCCAARRQLRPSACARSEAADPRVLGNRESRAPRQKLTTIDSTFLGEAGGRKGGRAGRLAGEGFYAVLGVADDVGQLKPSAAPTASWPANSIPTLIRTMPTRRSGSRT